LTNNCFKDLGLSGAVFIFAGTLSEAWRTFGHDNVLVLGRTILAICIIAFGVLHFVYLVFAPGIPPMFEYVGFLIPGHAFWVYSTAAALVCAGVSIHQLANTLGSDADRDHDACVRLARLGTEIL
jgi:hypothetical protein